jgi:hypothetical protein
MKPVWFSLFVVCMGLYATIFILYIRRERRASFTLVLNSYPQSTRRQWRRAVEASRRSATSPTGLETSTCEIPGDFLRAEKMRLESGQRMRPLILATFAILFLAEGVVGLAGPKPSPLAGDLLTSVLFFILAFVAWARGRSRGWAPTHRSVVGRRIAHYDLLLNARGH